MADRIYEQISGVRFTSGDDPEDLAFQSLVNRMFHENMGDDVTDAD